MGTVEGFRPSTAGLHYANCWPHVPDVKIPTPVGTVGLGDAANGLCGGMAYAVADLWGAGRPPPPSTDTPHPDSPAFDYVVGRLFDSFDVPDGIVRYYEWMCLPRRDTVLCHGTSWRTVRESLPRVRATVDAGRLCPLGLVCVHSRDPRELGKNHQVLAYGYEDAEGLTTLSLYDPNHPDRDDVCLSLDTRRPDRTTAIAYSTGDHAVIGFFVPPYAPRDPSPLFSEAART
jgi:hypothetical protein